MNVVNISSCDVWRSLSSARFVAATSMNLRTLKNRLFKLHQEDAIEIKDMDSLEECNNIKCLLSNYQSWIDFVILDEVEVEM